MNEDLGQLFKLVAVEGIQDLETEAFVLDLSNSEEGKFFGLLIPKDIIRTNPILIGITRIDIPSLHNRGICRITLTKIQFILFAL